MSIHADAQPASRGFDMKPLFLPMAEAFALQKDRFFIYIPVFLALGIGFYFALPFEPSPIFTVPFFILALGALLVGREHPAARLFLILFFLVTLGLLSAQIRTNIVHTPILQKEIGPVAVQGDIEAIENLSDEDGGGARLILSHLVIERLFPEHHPLMIRLKVRDDSAFKIGQRVEVLAEINPPSPPVMPGAFDFQRYLYFQGIGGVGFVYKTLGIIQESQNPWDRSVEQLRRHIDSVIEAHLPPEESPVAQALITGRQTAVSEADMKAMRNSGLAHMLSISGLHIGMLSVVVFFSVRLLLVCIPGFALYHPVKKYAAAVAFMAAFFYMVLAGANIPVQRSMMMTGIALFAVMIDRSPVSLRLVAFAAFFVLLFFPESLLSASFQMSFAAVTALIVFYDWLRPWWSKWHRSAGVLRRASLYLLGTCMTTVIASLATTPLGLIHFQQAAVYGLLANALAVPIMGFMIMPAAIIALMLMPFDLAHWPLVVMGLGVQWIIDIAHEVASLPMAVVQVQFWPTEALIFGTLGIILLVFWNGRFRFAGILPILFAVYLVGSYRQADILVSGNFDLAAYRADQNLFVSTKQKEKFSIQNWERMSALEEGASLRWPKEGKEGLMTCDPVACRLEKNSRKASFLFKPGYLNEECAWADVIVSFKPADKQNCGQTTVIDQFDGKRSGAHALWLENSKIRVQNTEGLRGLRPWGGLNANYKAVSGNSAAD